MSRFDEVRLEAVLGGEEVVIPLREGDDIPALLRLVADQWEAANASASWLRDDACRHVWDDSTHPGWEFVCLRCGSLMRVPT